LISQRAKGLLLTNAMWIREFVLNHPLYQHDSIVNDQIQYDLMWLIQQMSNNEEINSFIRSSNTKLDRLRY
jgi:glutamate--cysteine ligase catalytic subunit